jgi:transcriptional regulator of met regulon
MKSKPFLIAVAAFALTASGVQAFGNSHMLERAGLSQAQISAFEVAREKRDAGDFDGARDVLVEAGVDEEVLLSVHKAAHESRAAMRQALEGGDYEAFKKAVEGTPLAEDIDSEADFKKFLEAHKLKQDGKWDEAKDILKELGIEPPVHKGMMGHKGMRMGHAFQNLTDDQREALQVARQANDKKAVEAILNEAGIEMPGRVHR